MYTIFSVGLNAKKKPAGFPKVLKRTKLGPVMYKSGLFMTKANFKDTSVQY